MAELKDVKGIGPKSLSLLNKININTIEDLVTHYPFRYDILERNELSKVEDGEKITIDGKIESVPILMRFKAGLNKMNFRLVTQSGVVGVSIFNRAFLKRQLCVVTGVTFSTIFLAYEMGSIMLVFLVTSVMFGIMALIGYKTKTDLTKFSTLLFVALLSIIIVTIINVFIGSSSLEMILCIAGIVVFLGYTAGFLGIVLGLFVYINMLCSMKSFGVNFTDPLTPNLSLGHNSYFVKPAWKQEKRASYIVPKKEKSQPQISKKWKY